MIYRRSQASRLANALLRRHFADAVVPFEPYIVYRSIDETMEQGGTKRFSGKCGRTMHDGRELCNYSTTTQCRCFLSKLCFPLFGKGNIASCHPEVSNCASFIQQPVILNTNLGFNLTSKDFAN